jgi:hypothetical protein
MHFILSILFVCLSLNPTFAQEHTKDSTNYNTESVVKHFIAQLANPDIAVDIILSQHVIVEEPSDELYDYLEVSLEEIRINLMSKKIEEIQYVPFQKMAKKDIKDIDLEGLNPDNVFFLYYKGRQMLGIYVEQNAIGSFTLVANGKGKAHFILY